MMPLACRSSLVVTLFFLNACTMGQGMGGMMSGESMDMTGAPPEVLSVQPSSGRFDSEPANDADPSPNVVEVALEARASEIELAPGRKAWMWTYNGLLPGPRIEAQVGNTVRVHFKNSLPEATTIHWHGIRVPAAMDGTAAAQSPVQPGGEFTYEFTVPDAGTFWYHPHVRSDVQVERGLYGAFVVRGNAEPTTTSDSTVVLDDLLVDPSTWALRGVDATQTMLGREGNLILANGRARPIVSMVPGGLHRFRFINSANARYFLLALPGHKLIQIGSDGGLLPAPRSLDELLLVPGQRADVVIYATGVAGESFDWKTLPYNRGHGMVAPASANVFQSWNTDGVLVSTPDLPTSFAPIVELPVTTVRRNLWLEEAMGMDSNGSDMMSMSSIFSINGEVFPAITPLVGRLGSIEEWSVVNTTQMDHPFHLHGFRFQIISEAGRAPAFASWRDTVNIPANEAVVIRVPLEEHPGKWMFHCHILEHAERGMTGELDVAEP